MKTVVYEKPAMEFVSLRSEEAVADTCWGYHGSSQVFYWDFDGEGFMSFQIAQGSCALNLINVKYHPDQGSAGVIVDEKSAYYKALVDHLTSTGGGSAANPYKEMGESIFPNPDPEWS